MLAKKYRLPIQIFIGKKSKSLKTPYFLLKIFSLGDRRPYSRFGVIISKKVAKKAVERNLLKRKIFNFLREAKGKLPIAEYLIIVLPAVSKLNKDNLREELAKLFNF